MNVRDEASVLMIMAGKDIELLRHTVASDSIADEIFGFHAQQAVEKSLKAWINVAGGTFDRIHDIRRLLIVLQDLGLEIEQYRELIPLNSFAVQFRYAAKEDPISFILGDDKPISVEKRLPRIEGREAKAVIGAIENDAGKQLWIGGFAKALAQ